MKAKGFNPFESDINCLDPQIILNPRAVELIHLYGNFVIRGELTRYHISYFDIHRFPKWIISPLKHKITVKDLSSCYILDFSTGEIFPLYFFVPCGHCIVCQDSKAGSFSRRCQYESQLYDCDPIHITLTYNDSGLPKDKSVSLRHIQLWKKRLRICLERSNYGWFVDGKWYSPRLRMAIAAEYGKKNTRRPHYHIILWNYKPHGRFDIRFLHNYCWLCWCDERGTPMCDWKYCTVMPINNQYRPKGCKQSLAEMGKTTLQAFGYVSKYFYKQDQSCVPPGRKPLFHTFSKSKELGGIGAPFIDKHLPEMRKHIRKKYYYRDASSSDVREIVYDRYVLNRVFPSRFMSVSYRVRDDLRFLCRYVARAKVDCQLFSKRVLSQIQRFSRAFYFNIQENVVDNYCFRSSRVCRLIEVIRSSPVVYNQVLKRVEDYSLDMDNVLYLDFLRSKMLTKLYENKQPRNMHALALKLTRRSARRLAQFTNL